MKNHESFGAAKAADEDGRGELIDNAGGNGGEAQGGREAERPGMERGAARDLGVRIIEIDPEILGEELDIREDAPPELGLEQASEHGAEKALEHEAEKAGTPFYFTTNFRVAKQIFDAVDAETEEEKVEFGARFNDEYFMLQEGKLEGDDEPDVTFLLDPERLEGKMFEERGTNQVDWEGFKDAILMAVTKTEAISDYFHRRIVSTMVMSRDMMQTLPETGDLEFMRGLRDFQRKNYNDTIEQARQRKELERFYKEAAFGQVDQEMMERMLANEMAKFDFNKLMEIETAIGEDPEMGLGLAEDEITQVLGLQRRPELVFMKSERNKSSEGEFRSLGGCKWMGVDAPDRIMVDVDLHKQIGADETMLLATLMHENWHAWQDDRINDYLRDYLHTPANEANESILRSLGAVYQYNHNNYIKGQDDLEGYRTQLIEAEAMKFSEMFRERMQELKEEKQEKERIERISAEKPEIYTEANREGIEREVAGALTGMDMRRFLEEAGVNSALELEEKMWNQGLSRGEFEKVLDAAGEVARLEGALKVVDVAPESLREGTDLSLRPSERIIEIGEDRQIDAQIVWKGLYSVWDMRQREEMRRGSERGELYLENAREFLAPEAGEAYHRQVLVAEREEFATDVMEILSEQAQLDEVERMALPRRVLTKFQIWREKRRPEMSEKFKVRRQ